MACLGKGSHDGIQRREQVFGQRLHDYTIVNAIDDGNVLPFRVDYMKTMSKADGVEDEKVRAIDDRAALRDPERVEGICRYMSEGYGRKTNGGAYNSLFCCDGIPEARLYYEAMKRLSEAGEFRYRRPDGTERDLRFAVIYSAAANGEQAGGVIDDTMDASALSGSDKDFLDAAIADFRKLFPGEEDACDTTEEGFDGYYRAVTKRLRDGDLDSETVRARRKWKKERFRAFLPSPPLGTIRGPASAGFEQDYAMRRKTMEETRIDVSKIMSGRIHAMTMASKADGIAERQPGAALVGGKAVRTTYVRISWAEDMGEYIYIGYRPVGMNAGRCAFGAARVYKDRARPYGVIGFVPVSA